jgi:HEAT repeat protein
VHAGRSSLIHNVTIGGENMLMLKEIESLEKRENISKLNELLNYDDDVVKRCAAFAIGNIALKKKVGDITSIEPLTNLLSHSDSHIQLNAAFALTSLSGIGFSSSGNPTEILSNCLKNEDAIIRKRCVFLIYTLVKSGIEMKAIRDELIALTSKENEWEILDKTKQIFHHIDTLREELIMAASSAPLIATSAVIQNQPDDSLSMSELVKSSILLTVPQFLDADSQAEIVAVFKNISNQNLSNISLDFSDLEDFFEIDGQVYIKSLRPGMEIEKRIRIKPKEDKGTFPVKVILRGNGETQIKEYTIKVGGTEVY